MDTMDLETIKSIMYVSAVVKDEIAGTEKPHLFELHMETRIQVTPSLTTTSTLWYIQEQGSGKSVNKASKLAMRILRAAKKAHSGKEATRILSAINDAISLERKEKDGSR